MKNAILKMAAGSLLVCSSYCLAATGNQGNPGGIRMEINDLKTDLAQMVPLEDRLDQSESDKATKLLGQDGSQSLSNDITMALGELRNYQASARDEIACLREHWKHLTRTEKAVVEEARLDLERDRYAGP